MAPYNISIMLEKEFEYYLKHQAELVKKYEGRYLVIVGQKVVGDYESELEAYKSAEGQYKQGSYLIQPCLPGAQSHTQTFYSRVVF